MELKKIRFTIILLVIEIQITVNMEIDGDILTQRRQGYSYSKKATDKGRIIKVCVNVFYDDHVISELRFYVILENYSHCF